MSVFSMRDRRTLRDMLADLSRPVEILAFVEETQAEDARELVTELSALGRGALSSQVVMPDTADSLARALGVSRYPTFRFCGPTGEMAPIEMVGMPTGYQFGAFLALILSLTKGRLALNHAIQGALKNITHDVLLEVIVTATCPNCPEVVRLAQHGALANPARIHTRTVDAIQHPDAVGAGVEVVPYTRIWVDGRVQAERAGMMSATQFWRLIQDGLKGAPDRDPNRQEHS